MSPTTKRYQFCLQPELLEKAVNELNEPKDSSERLKAIDTLREAVKKSHLDIELLRNDDLFFLAFLRAKKFDQERALHVLENFHKQQKNWPEVMDKVENPALLSDFLNDGPMVPLNTKAKDGSTILVGRPGISTKVDFPGFIAAALLTIQTLALEDEQTQISGITVIEDFAYLSMDFAKQMSPSLASKFIGTVQDCMPVRVKSVNVTNEPKFFDFLWTIVSPFMKEKLKKRFRVHGTDFTKLFKEVADRSALPIMFAGTGPELPVEEWKLRLVGESTTL